LIILNDMRSTMILGVGEIGAINASGSQIKTLALGSCVAVILMDPITRSIGMAHIALPDSNISPDKVKELPGYFADTGIKVLIDEMIKIGCSTKSKKWVVKLVGGANVINTGANFDIGKRNVLAIKKTLWSYHMGVIAEDVFNNISRSVVVDVDIGRVRITSPGMEGWEI